jgi:hypothetical protein
MYRRIEHRKEYNRQKQTKAAETAKRIAEVEPCFDGIKLKAMKGMVLADQFKAYQSIKGPNVMKQKSAGLTADNKRQALIADAALYNTKRWRPFTEENTIDFGNPEDEWEDL